LRKSAKRAGWLALSWSKRNFGPRFWGLAPAARERSPTVSSLNWAVGSSSTWRGDTILAQTPARSRPSASQPDAPLAPAEAAQTRGGQSWVTLSEARTSEDPASRVNRLPGYSVVVGATSRRKGYRPVSMAGTASGVKGPIPVAFRYQVASPAKREKLGYRRRSIRPTEVDAACWPPATTSLPTGETVMNSRANTRGAWVA
jgi:hypothetical protein